MWWVFITSKYEIIWLKEIIFFSFILHILFYRFIISYFLSDDTVLVFEPPQRNSGILGGKFLERGRIKKPDGINYFIAQVRNITFDVS